MSEILFVTSEARPLAQTGGLGEVCGSLPPALRRLGLDLRLLMPAYRGAAAGLRDCVPVADLSLEGWEAPVRLLRGLMPDSRVPVYLLDVPPLYDRPGDPYRDAGGREWPDNPERFALLGRAAMKLGMGAGDAGWRPRLVHGHDWPAGLAIALLAREPQRPALVFTIHNLAHQGLYPKERFQALGLPWDLWQLDGLEFHGRMSFIKGGLALADWLTTVSPGYAREIQTPALGCGLDGLLRHRAERLSGILNGVDYGVWDPRKDPHIARRYGADDLEGKSANKRALQLELGLPEAPQAPLAGVVSRLAEQKGIDLILDAWPQLLARGLQLAVLGSGAAALEERLLAAARAEPRHLAVRLGYDEPLAHRIEAGADLFLMPSRFEPCGLNQIYSLRYGTLPVVRRTGGLADTVTDADPASLAAGTATGVVFDQAEAGALVAAVDRALVLYRDPARRLALQRTAMAQDFSWNRSAGTYRDLYQRLLAQA